MAETVITIEDLGKKYLLTHRKQEPYLALRDVLAEGARNAVRRIMSPFSTDRSGNENRTQEEFWALKNISFEVKQGDRLGIIGRNGAGKSTLLKILSRITEPTEGRVRIRGRVASLLEVGTGFHPELSGRENIYLNGAILGMTRTEIKRKFDEIVSFAEVEKFLDTPVKRYSSGMYVRLAFAVAAHLEPEILMVDEVLAVGDTPFQKKCLGKMEEVGKEGRTILFVSHNMSAIQNLCQYGISLNNGLIFSSGDICQVVDSYLSATKISSEHSLSARKDRKGSGEIFFTDIFLCNDNNERISFFRTGDNAIFYLYFNKCANSSIKNFRIDIGIDDQYGNRISWLSNTAINAPFEDIPNSAYAFKISIPNLPLVPGHYSMTIYSTINNVLSDWVKNAAFFDVEPGDFYNTGHLPSFQQGRFLMNYNLRIME